MDPFSQGWRLGPNGPACSRVVLGLWPIAGMTSTGVEDSQSVATVRAAIDAGVNCFDTAYAYGAEGRSDSILRQAIQGERERLVIISKVGQLWTEEGKRICSNDPATLIDHTEQILRRLETDYLDALLLHQIDPERPLEQTAEVFARLRRTGKVRAVGICNADARQAEVFRSVAGCDAVQFGFNMRQQSSSTDLRSWIDQSGTAGLAFWVLMKGILAGRIRRDHEFEPGDSRPGYEIYRGEQRERTHGLVDRLRAIAGESGTTVAQLVLAWTLRQPGVTAALVGAKRPDQITETAAAKDLQLDLETVKQVDDAVAASGEAGV